jgi:hypothetical protein
MSDQTLTQRLEALDGGTDFSDPGLYADLLGYNDQATTEPAAPAPQGENAPAAAAPAAAEPAPSNPAPAVAEPNASEIAGVLTKDGKHLMPFSVVQDLRSTVATRTAENTQLQAEVERLKAEKQALVDGTQPAAPSPESKTEEEIDAISADFPPLGNQLRELRAEISALKAKPEPAAAPMAPAVAPASPVQPIIDTMPLLVRWQARGGELWEQAVSLDNALKQDPQWAGKPMPERFAEVQRRVANDYGIPIPSAPSAPPAGAHSARPAPQSDAREVLPTLSDFSGGGVAIGDPMAGMTPGQMVDKAASMSVEDIRKMVGLSY